MADFGGVYQAKCIDPGPPVRVLIPAVFDTVEVPVTDIIGLPPTSGQLGFVAFIFEDASNPVWLGTVGAINV